MGISFVESLDRFGDASALCFEDGTEISYGALARRVAARASTYGRLRRLHLIEVGLHLEAIVSYLAALRAGHPVILVAPESDHAALIADYAPETISAMRDGVWQEASGPASTKDAYHPDLALLLSTSGSTGSRKLVRLSGSNLDANATAIAAFLELTAADRGLLSLPLHYSYGLSILHAHLAVGASLFVTASSAIAPGFLARVAAARCTNIAGVPYSYELFERIGLRKQALPDLRFMTVAGGRLDPDLVRIYARYLQDRGGRFYVMYGQTEATARIAYLPSAAAIDHADCVGIAIPGGALSLRDEAGADIAVPGKTGELVYRGANVMMGYATGRGDLARGPELTELATGDLAERTVDGYFRILGRKSRFSKIAGLRIGHDEVERHLAARGFTVALTGTERHLIAVLERTAPQDGPKISDRRDGLVQALAEASGLSPLQVAVVEIDALPRGATGKIDYQALADLAAARMATRSLPQGMETALEPVAEAFAEAFRPREVEPGDSFVSLGGDSLTYVQLTLALESIQGTLPADWERRSIANLTAMLTTRLHPIRTDKKAVPMAARKRVPLDANLFLRAIAILLVVLHHATLWPMPGGAATLLMLMGHSLARFQRDKLCAGQTGAVLGPVLRNVGFYYAILLAYCLSVGSFPWQSLLLVGNWAIDGYDMLGTPLITYWFVEAYAQLMLLLAGLFLLSPVRRAVARRPLAAGLVALAGCVTLRAVTPHVWEAGPMRPYVTTMILYLPAFGWCVHFAETRQRKWLLSLAALGIFPLITWMEGASATALWVRTGIGSAAALTLIWLPRLSLPPLLAGLLARIAAASYFIYLLHNVPLFLWIMDLGFAWPLRVLLHLVFGIGLGVAAYALQPLVSQMLMRRRRPVSPISV